MTGAGMATRGATPEGDARTPVLVNTGAGSCETFLRMIDEDRETNARCQVLCCESPQDMRREVLARVDRGVERLVIAGGDGTLSSVVRWIDQELGSEALRRVEIGVIPAGTGNDLARSLGLPTGDFEAAMAIALDGHARAIDAVRLGGDASGLCINCAVLGPPMERAEESGGKGVLGAASYWLAAAQSVLDPPEHRLRIRAAGHNASETHELLVHGLSLANGRTVGGGYGVAPDALLDDGLLDVMIVPAQGAASTGIAALATLGGFESMLDDRVMRARWDEVELEASPAMASSVDGEHDEIASLHAKIEPGACRFVCGPEAAVGGA